MPWLCRINIILKGAFRAENCRWLPPEKGWKEGLKLTNLWVAKDVDYKEGGKEYAAEGSQRSYIIWRNVEII